MVRAPIEATGHVAAAPERVFAFLAVLENHWALADELIELVSLEPRGASDGETTGRARGGRVRMRGPLGVSRTAVTRVVAARPSVELRGTARVGRRTRGRIAWTLREEEGGTSVTLGAVVEQAGALDRALLGLGAEDWLRRCFRRVLARLAEVVGEGSGATSPGAERARFVGAQPSPHAG